MLVSVQSSAQSAFLGITHQKSEVTVQDMTTGKQYSFFTKKEIIVPVDQGHDYFITVVAKTNSKTFVIHDTDTAFFDEEHYDMEAFEDNSITYTKAQQLEKEFSEEGFVYALE